MVKNKNVDLWTSSSTAPLRLKRLQSTKIYHIYSTIPLYNNENNRKVHEWVMNHTLWWLVVSAGSVYKWWCWCWTSIGGTQKATRLQRQPLHHPATWSMQLACRTKDRLVSLVLPPPACSADKLVSGASVEQASHLGSALLTVLCSQCSAHSALLTVLCWRLTPTSAIATVAAARVTAVKASATKWRRSRSTAVSGWWLLEFSEWMF